MKFVIAIISIIYIVCISYLIYQNIVRLYFRKHAIKTKIDRSSSDFVIVY